MKDLTVGEEVMADGEGAITRFLGWMERNTNKETDFILIETVDGDQLTLTGNHNVFYFQGTTPTAIYAKHLLPGDVMVGGLGEGKVISSMRAVTRTGYLDPLTGSGTLVTNNITTSCYASFPHHLANLALLPARLLPQLVLDNQESQHTEGTRTYVSTIKMIGRALGVGARQEKHGEVLVAGLSTVMLVAVSLKSIVM